MEVEKEEKSEVEVEVEVEEMVAIANAMQMVQQQQQALHNHHPYSFHVCGPRNLSSPNWRDIFISSWKNANYKRIVMACFIQAAYLLELDRQDNRIPENALAPNWWLPFKYKLTQTLIDERDGSIFGAVLEWNRSAAMVDFILMRPSGAPKAVLALRGTLLKSMTIRRDLTDDLRYLAWESLKSSVRFKVSFDALKAIAKKYGSGNVCVVGHSLGAGFALQVGKALAKEGIHVEAHLFNPPSVSLTMGVKYLGEKAGFVWKRFRSMLPSGSEIQGGSSTSHDQNKALNVALKRWIPHLYVNDSDYVCCYYADPTGSGAGNKSGTKENSTPVNKNAASVAAKLFVLSKGNQKFLDAHKLEQWWADDLELQSVINNSRLISRQLQSLYQHPASQKTLCTQDN